MINLSALLMAFLAFLFVAPVRIESSATATGSMQPTPQLISASPAASPSPGATSGYAHPEWLADAAWLKAHLHDPHLRVVALTPKADFEKGHIPGAAQIDWSDLGLVDTSDASVAKWRGQVEQKLTDLGITTSDTVVVYDGGTLYAPRLWWVLDQLGHNDKRVLNGGLAAWTAAGGQLETGPSRVRPASTPYQGTPNPSDLATLDFVKAHLHDPNVVLVDTRTPQEYAAGHIPGAININFTENALPNPPMYWKTAAQLGTLYADAGVTPGKLVITYCSTGVRSAVTYFTLRLIGYPTVRLYTGSWTEWSQHPELPKATGSTP